MVVLPALPTPTASPRTRERSTFRDVPVASSDPDGKDSLNSLHTQRVKTPSTSSAETVRHSRANTRSNTTVHSHRSQSSSHLHLNPVPLLTPELELEISCADSDCSLTAEVADMTLDLDLDTDRPSQPTSSAGSDGTSRPTSTSGASTSPPASSTSSRSSSSRTTPTAPLLLRRRSRVSCEDGSFPLPGIPLAGLADFGPAPGFRFGTCPTEGLVPAGTYGPSTPPCFPHVQHVDFPFGSLNRTATPTAELGPFEYPVNTDRKSSTSSTASHASLTSHASHTSHTSHTSPHVSQVSYASHASHASHTHSSHASHVLHAPHVLHTSRTPRIPLSSPMTSATAQVPPNAHSAQNALSPTASPHSPVTASPLLVRRPSLAAIPTISDRHRAMRSPSMSSTLRFSDSPVDATPNSPFSTDPHNLGRRGSIALGQISRLSRTLPGRPKGHGTTGSLSLNTSLNNTGSLGFSTSFVAPNSASSASPRSPATATIPFPGAGTAGKVTRTSGSPLTRPVYLPPRNAGSIGSIAFAHAALPAPVPPSLLARRGSVPANISHGLRLSASPTTASGTVPPLSPTVRGVPLSPTIRTSAHARRASRRWSGKEERERMERMVERIEHRTERMGRAERIEPENRRSPESPGERPALESVSSTSTLIDTPWDNRGDEVEMLVDEERPLQYFSLIHSREAEPFGVQQNDDHCAKHGELRRNKGWPQSPDVPLPQYLFGRGAQPLSTVPSCQGSEGSGDECDVAVK